MRDANTGELIVDLQYPVGVIQVAFTQDGRLIANGLDGSLRAYALDLDELTNLAESRVTRTLTEDECQQYLHMDSCPATD